MKMFVKAETWNHYQRLKQMEQRLVLAHRWLSEFDEMLEPFWMFIFQSEHNTSIDETKDAIRKRFRELR